jgi:ribosomal protein S18 acetylase RimI-like enzyme
MKKLWLLNDLFVHPNFRGLNISNALINEAKNLSKNTLAAGLILETAKTNTIGNLLYPKCGFELDNEHNFYSWNG